MHTTYKDACIAISKLRLGLANCYYKLLQVLLCHAQAKHKGVSSAMVGIIVSCSPLAMVILAPVLGYLVSYCNDYNANICYYCLLHMQLPRIGIVFPIMNGLLLVGMAYIALG